MFEGEEKKKKETWMCSGPPRKSNSTEGSAVFNSQSINIMSLLAWIHNALLSLASICFFGCFCYIAGATVVTDTKTLLVLKSGNHQLLLTQ